jgi:hypothetical protein
MQASSAIYIKNDLAFFRVLVIFSLKEELTKSGYLVVIVFACPSVLIITFGISWSLYCLSFGYNYYLRYLVVIVFACTSVLITTFGISERFLQIIVNLGRHHNISIGRNFE